MQKETETEKEKYRRDESKRNYVRNYSTKLPSKVGKGHALCIFLVYIMLDQKRRTPSYVGGTRCLYAPSFLMGKHMI